MKRYLALAGLLPLLAAAPARGAECTTVVHKHRAMHAVWRKLRRHGHPVRVDGRVVYVRVRRPYTRRSVERVCTVTQVQTVTVEAPQPTYGGTVELGAFTPTAPGALTGSIAYSVTVTRTLNGVTTPATEAAATLSVFGDGTLACALNVHGATVTGECPLTFPSAGSYPVILQYFMSGNGSTLAQTTTKTIEVGGA